MSNDETTRIIKRKSNDLDETVAAAQNKSNSETDSEPHTRIIRPGDSSIGVFDEKKSSSFAVEPVVGWLVVIAGPGKGNSLKLGMGMNGIGRNHDERVCLDFGDDEISRKSHALVTYDPKSNKFYAQHGGGVNLTYLNDSPLLQPLELTGKEIISLGNTKLCFVPFCDNEFSW
jgi:hypothetical protein